MVKKGPDTEAAVLLPPTKKRIRQKKVADVTGPRAIFMVETKRTEVITIDLGLILGELDFGVADVDDMQSYYLSDVVISREETELLVTNSQFIGMDSGYHD